MNTRTLSALCVALSLGFGCADDGPTPALAPRLEEMEGGFEYLAYSETGELLLAGTVTLAAAPDSTLTGSWNIQWAPGSGMSAVVGPQVGAGMLHGHFGGQNTMINLNPEWADNNVYLLTERSDEQSLTGRWEHSTFVGPVAEGPFTLRRLND